MPHLKIILYADFYNDRAGQSGSYVTFFEQFGEVILVTAQNDLDYIIGHGDVLALPGGADVDPLRYGEKPRYECGRTNPHYEYLDKYLLTPWLTTGKPIIGICRGLQTLNVAAGGSLFQHIDYHVGSVKPEDRGKAAHPIFTTEDFGFKDEYGEEIDYNYHGVNSFHHQAIKQVAPGFNVIGWSHVFNGCPSLRKKNREFLVARESFIKEKNNGFIRKENKKVLSIPEIILHETMPWIAFQYHPEDMGDPLAVSLIERTLSRHYGVQELINN